MLGKSLFVAASAVLMLSSPTILSADEGYQSPQAITAMGQRHQYNSWLATSGPTEDGAYMAWISVSDLNLASQSGQAMATTRVKKGVQRVCERSVNEPQGLDATYRPLLALAQCRTTTFAAARPQLDRAFAYAGKGGSLANLTIGFRRLASAR